MFNNNSQISPNRSKNAYNNDESDNDIDNLGDFDESNGNILNNANLSQLDNKPATESSSLLNAQQRSTNNVLPVIRNKTASKQKTELFHSLKPNIPNKERSNATLSYIKVFLIALAISCALFILNLSLGVFIWLYKGSFFGTIFFALGITSLLIVIFNIVSVLLFKKKFNEFMQSTFNGDSEIEMLDEADVYDALQKSTESSLMSLGMYLLMFLIVLYFIFALATFSFHSQVKSEINSYANNRDEWEHIYKNFSYSKITSYLTSFIISFGALSLVSIGVVAYLFYLSFRIVGFFQIYQKIVQFITLIYLQLGIAFLYFTINMTWFKDLHLIQPNYISWLPTALLISSLFVIVLSLFAYVGAKNKNVKWLIITCVVTALFISMFVVFAVCTAISAKSLEHFNDNQCPTFIDYFNEKYIHKNSGCDKYTQTAKTIQELNCQKERIVTFWESGMDVHVDDTSKEFMYGCVNISCCYKVYNFMESFHYYVNLFGFCLIVFGLVLIGCCFFFISLLQQNYVVSAEETRSQYSVYCFVGVITLVFIVLLCRTHLPKYSPSFANKFKETAQPTDMDLMYIPFSVIKANKTLDDAFTNQNIQNDLSKQIINEDYSKCKKQNANCPMLHYVAEIRSDTYKVGVDENTAKALGYKYAYQGNSNKQVLYLFGDSSVSHKLFDVVSFTYDNINPKICEMKPIIALITVTANSTGNEYYHDTSAGTNGKSFVQLTDTYNKDIVTLTTQADTGYTMYNIDMSKVKPGVSYTVLQREHDFSLVNTQQTQMLMGRVLYLNNDKFEGLNGANVVFSYLNFPNCAEEVTTTTSNGEFVTEAFPVMKNNVVNELRMFVHGEHVKTVTYGGIDHVKEKDIGDVIMSVDLYEEGLKGKFEFSFKANVIDSTTTKVIENVTVNVFEGDVYFPNAYMNMQKYNYQKLNSEYLIASTQTNEKGEFEFQNILTKPTYTFIFDKKGYYNNIYTYRNSNNNDQHTHNTRSISLTPIVNELNEFRIVLEWVSGPYDLNVFSYFKSSDKDQCEVFFGNKKCQFTTLNNENYNNGTQGSQVMTVEKVGNYTYTFAVKQFVVNDDPVQRGELKALGAEGEAPKDRYPPYMRNLTSDEMKMSLKDSKAVVKVFTSGYNKEIFKVDINAAEGNDGEFWVAFCLDGLKGISSIEEVNRIEKGKINYKYCENIYNNKQR